MPATVPIIRPISDLRTDLNSICSLAAESREPIFMTKNGKASLVVIDCQAWEDAQQHERMVQKLREAEIEAKYLKRSVPRSQLDAKMGELFSLWGV